MGESWITVEQLDAKRAEFEALLGPAWRRPAASALTHEAGGRVVVDRVELGEEDLLPALVLATVAGVPASTGSVRLTAAALDAAIALLAPAQGCLDLEQPALRAGDYLRREIGAGGEAAWVFLDALDIDGREDRHVAAVLAEIHRGRVENPDATTTLWRPVGPAELDLLVACGMSRWPPRLPDQPFFYPVLNAGYARDIAMGWNVVASGSGYVTRFAVHMYFGRRYPTRQAGGARHLELWIPAEDVDELNEHLLGPIELVAEHR